METGRKILLDRLNNTTIHSNLIDILKNYEPENPKSAEASAEARKKGNDLLLKQKRHDAETHKAIFSHYCESIALAPMESQELAMAYGNRSYLLLHMQKYEECIEDINRAMEMSIPDVLKAKLLCRKAECRKRLGAYDVSLIFEMIESLIGKIGGQDRMNLQKMLDSVKALDVGTKKVGMSRAEQKRKTDHNLPVTEDYTSRISIEYSEKYGRQVMAARDYKPGDIIFVEKMYASAFIDGYSLLACDHCQKHVWSSIPCNYCNWAMYCSESCKKEAWDEYHDIDCSLIFHLNQCVNLGWKLSHLAIRILVMAIKETGSIVNLKKELESLAQSEDDSSRDFFKNGQSAMKNIRSVCSLAVNAAIHTGHIGSTRFVNIVPYILLSLTKYSILKDDFNIKQVEDLEMNKDIMFLGSLLIKLAAVIEVNGFCVNHHRFVDSEMKSYSADPNNKFVIEHFDERDGLCIVFSLLNHSCFPSAEWCCTESNKIIVYAQHPIKKNSQIFIQYRNGFDSEFQSVRQAELKKDYNFTCECRACVEEWRPIKMAGFVDEKKEEPDFKKDIRTGKFEIKDLSELVEVVENGGRVDKLHIEKLSALITHGMHWTQPSVMLCYMTNLLIYIFHSTYSPEPLFFYKCD